MYASPVGLFVTDLVFSSASRFAERTAIIDTSCSPARHISYSEYADLVRTVAASLVTIGIRRGQMVAIFLPNSWEFCVAFHAIELAGAVPTPLNPSYREREVHYQLESSDAVALITDGAQIRDISLEGLPLLKRVFYTRTDAPGAESFSTLLRKTDGVIPAPMEDPRIALAALPYSSGTTGLPKGVMLSHSNLVANVSQTLGDPESAVFFGSDICLCFLPMYHIYGMNVVLNPVLAVGATLVLMARFDPELALRCISKYGITCMPCVPPVLNIFCGFAERGLFPTNHSLRWVKSGAAPLPPELARRFRNLTSVPVRQGYGMTEASPVTHMGYLEQELYRPESIGRAVALTDCRIVNEQGNECATDELGELVMRGPQFMLGYWKAPEATDAVMRDGWYLSGDIVRRDADDFYFVVDRRKEMIKYKGFAVAPAEVESVLMEHPQVRDCGVVGRADNEAGEIPCAFIVLREGGPGSEKLKAELSAFVAEHITRYKQPREVVFVANIPRNPSGKILRRELRKLL